MGLVLDPWPLRPGPFLWTLPYTLLGVLLALLSGTRPRYHRGLFIALSDRGFAHLFLTRRGFVAMTLGRVILTTRPLTMATWVHELVHVQQYERWGPLFLPHYLWWHVRRGYQENPFERAAAAVAARLCQEAPDRAAAQIWPPAL